MSSCRLKGLSRRLRRLAWWPPSGITVLARGCRGVLVDNFSLKPGDESEVVAATIDAHRGVKDVRRAQAVDRMRDRGWRFLEGYAFDRDEADA